MLKTIAEIKETVLRMEGFDLHIRGKNSTAIDVWLNETKGSKGSMLPLQWIAKSFSAADIESRDIAVLLAGTGKDGGRLRASKNATLTAVRETYPKQIRDIAKSAEEATRNKALARKAKAKAKAIQLELDAVETDRDTITQDVIAKTEDADYVRKAFEDALDKVGKSLHPYALEHAQKTCGTLEIEPSEYIAALLRRLSFVEKEKDGLNFEITDLKSKLEDAGLDS